VNRNLTPAPSASQELGETQNRLQASQQSEQEALRQSEWLRVTLSSIGDAVICTDSDGRITFLNGVAEALTGWPADEAIGRPITDVFVIIDEQHRQVAINPTLEALREGRTVRLVNHTLLIARDGTEHPIEDSAAPIRVEGGPPLGAVLVFHDVSQRRQIEETRARLAAIVESTEDAIISKGLDGIIRTWNPAAERLFGYSASEAIGRSITCIIPPERLPEEDEILSRLIRGERIEHYETVRVTKDGRRLHISLTISPLRGADGTIIGAAKVARDITHRVESERKLAESLSRLEIAVQLSGIGFWHCDLPFAELSWDDKVREHFWLPPGSSVTIETFYERMHPDDREPTRLAIDASINGNSQFDIVYRTVDPASGAFKWIRALGGAVRDSHGKVVRFDGVTVDVSSQKQAEESLRESDRRKDDFLALLAHELRNPLAPLRAGLELLRRHASASDDHVATRDMMQRQLTHLVRLIDDLLDIARVNRNKLRLARRRLRLSEAIQHAIETVQPLVAEGQHELIVSLPDEPILLDGDLTRLAQVFANLLANSARYTPRGGCIVVSAALEGEQVVVKVSDTGIGIPAHALPTIFDMFSQVERSLESEHGGLGIGLALVKGLVEMHGGSVAAASGGRGKGSTFTVILPMAGPVASPLDTGFEPESSEPLAGEAQPTGSLPVPNAPRRLLIVDDNRDAATTLAMLLRLKGNEVSLAHDGLEAIEVAERVRPQVILMDLGMPKLNGYDATRRIRTLAWGNDVKVIALTGWGQASDRAKSQEAGCNAHLVKPVDLEELEALLKQFWP
jgi:PAS domain S-box-containing protein